jgi:hypothetical protein
MVKSLADELTQILDWIEDAGINQVEHARTGLVIFCRGFVCGLRANESIKADSELAKELESEWKKSEGNADARDRSMMCKTPSED